MRSLFWNKSIIAGLMFYMVTFLVILWASGCEKNKSQNTNPAEGVGVSKASEDEDFDEDELVDDEEQAAPKKVKKEATDKKDTDAKTSQKKDRTQTQTAKNTLPAKPGPTGVPTGVPPTGSGGALPSNPDLARVACNSNMTAPQLLAWVAQGIPAPGMTPEQFAEIKASLDGVTEEQLDDFLKQNCPPKPPL